MILLMTDMLKKILFILLVLILALTFFLFTPDKSIGEMKELYTDDTSQFIDVQGMSVHFKKEGQGVPLLLLHGTASSLHTWDSWTEILKDSFLVVRLDLPAYGLTGPRPDRDYGTVKYISFINEFMEAINIDSFHIAGNSFGGGLAFVYAGHYPEKVGKLILLDAGGLPNESHVEAPLVFRLAQNPILSNALKKITPISFIRKNIEEVYANDDLVTDELVERYHSMATREGNRQAFIDRTNTPNEDFHHYLEKLEEPTLIMWGKEDAWISYRNAERFDRLIPNSRVVIYADVGHLPMEEYPSQSAEDARKFLKSE